MGLLDDTRPIRRALFDFINQPPEGGPATLLRYQLELADAIRGAELCLRRGGEEAHEIVHHIARLRTYADGFAWLILHPHAIRQLAKNSAVQKTLIDQGDAFDNVLAFAGSLCTSTGFPVLVADITNVIRIGDILLVADEENPTIVECKLRLPDTKHLMQGRIGRQLSRAVGTTRYLKRGQAKVFGEDHHRMVVEAKYGRKWHWAEVEDVCRLAIKQGMEVRELSAGNWIWAFRPSHEDAALQQVADIARGDDRWQFGTSLGARRELYAPPCVWPLPADLQFELSEGDLVVFRLIDYASFAGQCGPDRTIAIADGDYPIVVSVSGQEARVSSRFIYDALYGFETVNSCVEGILEFVNRVLSSASEDLQEASGTKPSIYEASDPKSLEALLDRIDVGHDDLVAFPVGDLSHFPLGQFLVSDGVSQTLSIIRVGEMRRLRSER